jgi:hypothetical protein
MTLHDDDVLHEIGRALAVEPSREFGEGVRRRVARRRVASQTAAWGLAIAAGLVLVATTQWPDNRVVPTSTIVRTMPVPSPVEPDVPAEALPSPPVVRARPARREPRREIAQTAATPEIVVVTNQLAVLQAVWAGHQVTAAEAEAPMVEAPSAGIQSPIVIDPVRVLPVVIAADERRPADVLPTIRRGFAATEAK